MTHEVSIHVYDISLGSASHLSKDFLGVQVDGVWHTGIVCYGYEYFFGKVIHRKTSKQFEEMFGRPPVKRIVLGQSSRKKKEFEKFATSEDFNKRFSPETYDFFENNCNHFTRVAIEYLFENSKDAVFTEEVEEILENREVIKKSPSAKMMLQLYENGRQFGSNFIAKLMDDNDSDDEGGDEEGEGRVNAEARMDSFVGRAARTGNNARVPEMNPEKTITGVLSLLEGIFTPDVDIQSRKSVETELTLPKATNRTGGTTNGSVELPPGAEEAARKFGRNIVDAINLINISVSTAIKKTRDIREEVREETRTEKGDTDKTTPRAKAIFEGRNRTKNVPVRAEVRELLAKAFSSPDEEFVQRKVIEILEKEGYYSLDQLKELPIEELLQIGIKRGWAKTLKMALDKHFDME